MLDYPAAADALWSIYNATGVRPEWLLPVLFHESGFNPAATNGAYHGIGQNSPKDIERFAGVDPATYLTWPASRQLATVVRGYFSQYAGRIHSAGETYQAEFLPATLGTKGVLASRGQPFYDQNSSLDPNGDGQITTDDLSALTASIAVQPAVQSAIQQTYATRRSWWLFAGILGVGALAIYAIETGRLPVKVRSR